MDDLNSIFNEARKLADMLLETTEGKALNDARYIFEGNEEAQNMLNEYSIYRRKIQTMANNDEISDEELEQENEKIAARIKELQQNEVIRNLFVAEQNFNNIVNHVMNVFNATLAGQENIGGCSGSCATCGGCH